MILKQDTFTYDDMIKLLSSAEVKTLIEIIKYMNDDNIVYLYQGEPSVINKVAINLKISKATVQNRISSIMKKQNKLRYFMYPVTTGIKGEYFISPELVINNYSDYDIIYADIIPVLLNTDIKGVVLDEK